MKKSIWLVLAIFICALFAASAFCAAPTIAQHKANQCVTCSSVTVTLTSTVAAGDDVWVWVGTDDSTRQTISTPTMTGETFVNVAGCTNNPGGGTGHGQLQCYHLSGGKANGGNSGITSTASPGTVNLHIWAIQVHGQNQSSTPDASGNAQHTASSGLTVSTSGATTNATDLVISCQYDDANSGGTALTASTGYTIVDQSDNGSGNDTGATEDKTTSSTGTQSAAVEGGFPGANDNINMSIVAIAPGTSSPKSFPAVY